MQKQPLALIGCGLLAFGVFAPAVTIPIAGEQNLLALGDRLHSGWIMLAIAVLALGASLLRVYSFLWMTGLGSFMLGGWLFVELAQRSGEVVFQWGWGWPVMAAGAIAMLVAAGIGSPAEREDPLMRWLRNEKLASERRCGKPDASKGGTGVPL